MNKKVKKLAFLGLCTSLALIFAYVEVLIPPLFASVPGIKLGLPNIVIIFILYKLGAGYAAAVSFLRIYLASLLFGNPVTFVYSVAGGFLSLLLMAILKKTNLLSPIGVSVAGGVFHNVGQILVAILLLGTKELGYYLVALAVSGTLSGIFIGLCGGFAMKRVPNKFFGER